MNTTALSHLAIAAAFLGQAPPETDKGKEASDERLVFMRDTLAPLHLSVARSGAPLRLREEPAFRMGRQPADNIEEGAIFLWTGEDGRPEAAVQVFQIRDRYEPKGLWIHEFVSLSPGAVNGERGGGRGWSPGSPGVEFKPIPGAPRPATARAQLDRQLRGLAREFRASDFFKDKVWTDLRLLPTPVARYGKEGSAVGNGALFAFATGTDPEAFLFLEVREGESGPEWQYAFAPMTCWALTGSHRGKTVWTIPVRMGAEDPSRPYFIQPLR